jgi:hypothetical protein
LTWEKLAKLVDTMGGTAGTAVLDLGADHFAGLGAAGSVEQSRPGGRWPTALREALRTMNPGQESGGDTMAFPDKFLVPKEEDTKTEVTASVLLARGSLGGPAGDGVPAWLARAVARPEPPMTPAPPVAQPAPVPRTSSAGGGQRASPTSPPTAAVPASASAVAPADADAARAPAPAPGLPAVRPPQPSWVSAAPGRDERPPWEDSSTYPRVLTSLGKPEQPRQGGSVRRDVVELLWFDQAATKRVRQRWRKLADDLEFAPLDDRHDLPSDDPQQARDRHIHFGILTEAAVSETSELGHVVREAISESGRFTPPLIVVSGRLQFPFHDLEILRATAATLTPIAGDDKRLKEALANVKELLETPLMQHSNELVDNFTKHLRSLYDQSRRTLSREYLDTSVERLLLEQRRYQKRPIFDGAWIRGLLSPMHGGEPVPTYLPEILEKMLPMMVSFKVRMIVEAHVKQDQYESHPHALRVVTLGRVLDIDRGVG